MKEPEIYKIAYTHDKLGRKNGIIYYYKVLTGHLKLIDRLLRDFDISSEDEKMLRRLKRTGEYSEFDRDRLAELRTMYIQDYL